MIEKDAYKAEKEARERRLMAYSDRIQNRMKNTLGTGTRNCKLKFCEKSIKQTGIISFMGRMPVCRRHGILKVLDSCRNCDRMIFDRCTPVAKFFGMDYT